MVNKRVDYHLNLRHWLCLIGCIYVSFAMSAQISDEQRAEMYKLYSKTSTYLRTGKPDSAFLNNEKMLDYFAASNDTSVLAWYYNNIAAVYMMNEQPDTAAVIYKKAEKLAAIGGDEIIKAIIAVNQCTCYLFMPNYVKAYQSCIQAVDQSNVANKPGYTIIPLINLAQVNAAINELDSAITYLEKARSVAEAKPNKRDLVSIYGVMANVQIRDSAYTSALKSIDQALAILDSNPVPLIHASAYYSKGRIYSRMGRYHAAIDAYQLASAKYRDIGNRAGDLECISAEANAYIQLGDLDKARQLLDSVAVEMEPLADQKPGDLLNYYLAKLNLADAIGDSVSGMHFYLKYLACNDSISNNEDKAAIQAFQVDNAYRKVSLSLSTVNAKYQKIQKELKLLLVIGGIVILILVFVNRVVHASNAKLERKVGLLRKRLYILQNRQLILQPIATNGDKLINRHKLEQQISFTLNENDWTILRLLSEAPTLSNKELATKAGVSNEALRASLKNMYKGFKVGDQLANKKLALVKAAVQLTNR